MWKGIKPVSKSEHFKHIPCFFNSQDFKWGAPNEFNAHSQCYGNGQQQFLPLQISFGSKKPNDCINFNRMSTEQTNRNCIKPSCFQCELLDNLLNRISTQKRYIVADEATNWYRKGQAVCMPQIQDQQPKLKVKREFPVLKASQFKRVSPEFLQLLQKNSDRLYQKVERILLTQEPVNSTNANSMPDIETRRNCVKFSDKRADDCKSPARKSKKHTKKCAQNLLLIKTETFRSNLKNVQSKELWKSIVKNVDNNRTGSSKLKSTELSRAQSNTKTAEISEKFTMNIPLKKASKLKESENYEVDVLLKRRNMSGKSEKQPEKVQRLKSKEPLKSILKRREFLEQESQYSKEKGTQTETDQHKSRSFLRNIRIRRKPTPHFVSHLKDIREELTNIAFSKDKTDGGTSENNEKKPKRRQRLKGGYDNYTDSSIGSYVGKKPILSLHELHRSYSYQLSNSEQFQRNRHHTQDSARVQKMAEESKNDYKAQNVKDLRSKYKVQQEPYNSSEYMYREAWKTEAKNQPERNVQQSRIPNSSKYKASSERGPNYDVYNSSSKRPREPRKHSLDRSERSMEIELSRSSCIESPASKVRHRSPYRRKSRQQDPQHYRKQLHRRRALSNVEISKSSCRTGSSDFIRGTTDQSGKEADSDLSNIDGSSERRASSSELSNSHSKSVYIAIPKWKLKNINRATKYLRVNKSLIFKNTGRYANDQISRLQSGSELDTDEYRGAKKFGSRRHRNSAREKTAMYDDNKQTKYHCIHHENSPRHSSKRTEENYYDEMEEIPSKDREYYMTKEPRGKAYEFCKTCHEAHPRAEQQYSESFEDTECTDYEKPKRYKKFRKHNNFEKQDSFEDYSEEFVSPSRQCRSNKPNTSNRKSKEEHSSKKYHKKSQHSARSPDYTNYNRNLNEQTSHIKHNAEQMDYSWSNESIDSEQVHSHYRHAQKERVSSGSDIPRTHLENYASNMQPHSSKKHKINNTKAENLRSYKSRKDIGHGQNSASNTYLEDEFIPKAHAASEELIGEQNLYHKDDSQSDSEVSHSSVQSSEDIKCQRNSVNNTKKKSNLKSMKGNENYNKATKEMKINYRYPSPSYHMNGFRGQVVIKKIMREDLLNKSNNIRKFKKNPYDRAPQSYRVIQDAISTRPKYIELEEIEPEYILGRKNAPRSKPKRNKN